MAEIAYRWQGVWNAGADGWYEFFGGDAELGGLPCRDLTAEDVAGLTEAQKRNLHSPTGKRLYLPVKKAGGGGGSGSGPAEPPAGA